MITTTGMIDMVRGGRYDYNPWKFRNINLFKDISVSSDHHFHLKDSVAGRGGRSKNENCFHVVG